jgi:two-component system nitrogen regulation sensor histidine kinase NtrY
MGHDLIKNILLQVDQDNLESSESIEIFKAEFENLQLSRAKTKDLTFYVWPANQPGILGKVRDEISVWRNYRTLNDRTTHHLKKEFFQALRNHETENPFDFYGSLYWVKKISTKYTDVYFVLIQRYPSAIRGPLIEIQNSISDYQQLKSMRNPIYFSYICTFILVTLLILLLSIWCAFYFARGLGKPIQELLNAMGQIRNGTWDVQINYHPENDLKHLTHGFNDMTNALKAAHLQLDEKNREMMLILENIRASVFLVNKFGRIITLNTPGQKMALEYFGLSECQNKKINIFIPEIKNKIIELTRELIKTRKQHVITEISFTHQGQDRTFMIHLAKINIEHSLAGPEKGLLIFIEDLTDIVKINTLKTWQEAAKQMAHEIKNPLTPIQIATQRLQRKYGIILNNDPAFIQCTETILEQVKTIKDLVSHFSKFASMPELVLEATDLNNLITETTCLYKVSYPEIDLILSLDGTIPEMKLDKKKIRRVLTNLLDNSVRAIQQAQPVNQKLGPDYKAFIKIQTRLINQAIANQAPASINQATANKVEILFTDNGPGIPKSVQNKLFMPYVSTEKKNMGLGLAIVRDAIEQMGGKIELIKIESGNLHIETQSFGAQEIGTNKLGAQFKIELPVI